MERISRTCGIYFLSRRLKVDKPGTNFMRWRRTIHGPGAVQCDIQNTDPAVRFLKKTMTHAKKPRIRRRQRHTDIIARTLFDQIDCIGVQFIT